MNKQIKLNRYVLHTLHRIITRLAKVTREIKKKQDCSYQSEALNISTAF